MYKLTKLTAFVKADYEGFISTTRAQSFQKLQKMIEEVKEVILSCSIESKSFENGISHTAYILTENK